MFLHQSFLSYKNYKDWGERANAFEDINEFISELKPYEQPSSILMNQMINAHIQHLNDHHYKVVIACQESFSRLITIYSDKVLSHLDQIIPLVSFNSASFLTFDSYLSI